MRLFHFRGRLRGPELYATGTAHLPRWASDGGNGSVASVLGMTGNESAQCWGILRALVDTFEGYSIDLEQVGQFMDAVEEQIKSH